VDPSALRKAARVARLDTFASLASEWLDGSSAPLCLSWDG
jgi:hypothetical protein